MEKHLDEEERSEATGGDMGEHDWQDTDTYPTGAAGAGAGAGAGDDLKHIPTANPMMQYAKAGRESWIELQSNKKSADASLTHAQRHISKNKGDQVEHPLQQRWSQSTPGTDYDMMAAVRSRADTIREVQKAIRPRLKQLFAHLHLTVVSPYYDGKVRVGALHNYDGKVSVHKLVRVLKRDDNESSELRKLLGLPEECSIEDKSTREAFEIFLETVGHGADEIPLQRLLDFGDEHARTDAKANWKRSANLANLFAKKTRSHRTGTAVAIGE
jgi:hypothetical protein